MPSDPRRGRAGAAAALAALALLALHPLFRGRLVIGHDALQYPPRLVQWMRALADGHLPPLWAPDLGNGFGQPLFAFAPPLLYAVATPLRALGASLPNALQLAVAALCAAGAAAVYRLGRRQRAPRDAAVAVAALWLFAPYLTLDLFVRAAFAEAAGLALLPVALLALARALERPEPRRIAACAAAVALLPLAHFPVALLAVPAVVVAGLAEGVGSSRLRRATGVVGAAVAGGLALAAFSWLPAIVEKDFVKVELLRQARLHWRQHAVVPAQLLAGEWGHGLSVPGPGDGMSFAIGPLHLLLALLGLSAAWRGGNRAARAVAAAAALLAAGGAWLATTASATAWERLPLLQYLAFPWRALMLPALFCSLLALPALLRLPRPARLAILGATLALNLPHVAPKGFNRFADRHFAPEVIARRGVRTTTLEEYEPRQVARRPPWQRERLTALDGEVAVLAERLAAHRQRWRLRVATPARVEAATFWYPGWTATLDGEPLPVEVVPGRGTMAMRLPPGEHELALALRPTAVRRAAGLLSAAAAAGLLAATLAGGARRPGRGAQAGGASAGRRTSSASR